MHDYDKRYNVSANYVSHYTDDPAEALRLYQRGLEAHERSPRTVPAPFINEGYSSDRDVFCGGEFMSVEVTRRTTRSVPPTELEFLVARNDAQALIERLRKGA